MQSPTCRRVLFALLCLSLACGSCLSAQAEIRFLDVGQGDAILLRSGGKTALVDAGPNAATATYLRRLGVTSLDLLVLSHPHADHIGGALAVVRSVPTTYFLDDGVPYTSATYRGLMAFVERKGIRYLAPAARTIQLGDLSLRIIPPAGSRGASPNNQSVGVVLQDGAFTALLPGDSEAEEINRWLDYGQLPRGVTVLKAAHHGSRDGVSPRWLATLKPRYVVISVGAGNEYGHPHPAALRYYQAGGRTVLRTDQGGDVVFSLDRNGHFNVQRGPERSR